MFFRIFMALSLAFLVGACEQASKKDSSRTSPGIGDRGEADSSGENNRAVDQSLGPHPVFKVTATNGSGGGWSQSRKDKFLDGNVYDEPIEAPDDGNRIEIVLSAKVSGRIASVEIEGKSLETLHDRGDLHWYHIWPKEVSEGASFWIRFHSDENRFVQSGVKRLKIVMSDGNSFEKDARFGQSHEVLTYITTADDYKSLLIHGLNRSGKQLGLEALEFNGLRTEAVIQPNPVAPGGSFLWQVIFEEALEPGLAWTLAALWQDGSYSSAGGRVIAEHFPVHTWPKRSNCLVPEYNETWFLQHVAAGFDTFFTSRELESCGDGDASEYQLSFKEKGAWMMASEFVDEGTISLEQGTISRLLGDEVDTNYGRGDGNKLMEYVKAAERTWEKEKGVASYIGGSRNRRIGLFSGIADIQGMDFYVSACAPHVTAFGKDVPLRGSFDYLENTRLNHAPHPTWLYAQGFSNFWNLEVLGQELRSRQPNATEMVIHAGSVIAAGGKGIMWFQTVKEEIFRSLESESAWKAIGILNREIRALSPYLREGDPTIAVTPSVPNVIARAIRSRDAIVIPVLNINVLQGPTDIDCTVGHTNWKLNPVNTALKLNVPFEVSDAFTLTRGVIEDASLPTGGTGPVEIPSLQIGDLWPLTYVVLARTKEVRNKFAQSLL